MSGERPEYSPEYIQHVIDEFGEFLIQIRRKVPRLIEGYCAPFGITALAAEAFEEIDRLGDDATLTAIGERIGASASTMTGVAAQLERLGYVQRVPSPIDRRASILRITDDGRQTLAEIPEKMIDDFHAVLEIFPDDDVDTALRIFRETVEVIDHLIELNDESPRRRS